MSIEHKNIHSGMTHLCYAISQCIRVDVARHQVVSQKIHLLVLRIQTQTKLESKYTSPKHGALKDQNTQHLKVKIWTTKICITLADNCFVIDNNLLH